MGIFWNSWFKFFLLRFCLFHCLFNHLWFQISCPFFQCNDFFLYDGQIKKLFKAIWIVFEHIKEEFWWITVWYGSSTWQYNRLGQTFKIFIAKNTILLQIDVDSFEIVTFFGCIEKPVHPTQIFTHNAVQTICVKLSQ